MPDLDDVKSSARELYKKVLGVPSGEIDPGRPAAADGITAVAQVEAAIVDGAGLGSTYPANGADRAFASSAAPAVARLVSGSGRASLASAIGLASAGARATAFLSGPDLLRAGDLLASAAGRRLPLVVHLADREPGAVGGGHGALHAAAVAGAVVLVASSVQEAVDLTLAGRRVAEDALVPVVVAMDGVETAASVQDVLLPSPALLAAYLGSASDMVHPLVRSQEMLFGRHRPRVPRWHDPSRPLTAGTLHGPEAAPLAAAGRAAYLDAEVPALLDAALADLGRRTGRPLATLTTHKPSKGKVLLVALGAAVGTAQATAEALEAQGLKVGVVGIRSLAPLPADGLAELLDGKRPIVVLERAEGSFEGDAPLAGRLRALVGRHQAAAAGRSARSAPKAAPAPMVSALYGLGGAPLAAADLAALCREVVDGAGQQSSQGPAEPRSTVYLGVSFEADAMFPKREVLLDALDQSYPAARRLGLKADRAAEPGGAGKAGKSKSGAVDPRPEGSTTVALYRLAGRGGERLAADAARILHGVAGGRVATRPGLTWERWATPVMDRLLYVPGQATGTGGPLDPGADGPVDLAVWCTPAAPPPAALVERLSEGGALVVPRKALQGDDLTDWWTDLPAPVRQAVEGRGATLHVIDVGTETDPGSDLMLGALFAALRAEGRIEVRERKLLAALGELDGTEGSASAERRTARFQTGLDRVHAVTAGDLSLRRRPPEEPDPVPAAVRRLAGGRTAETMDSLPRFWDQVGVLYRRGEEGRLTPDPYLASGAVPALSGSLRRAERGRTLMPAFSPALCTGCGDCWTACPDGALGPAVLGAADLMKHAMGRARKAGHSVDALNMAVSKVAAAVHQELAARPDGETGGDAAEIFTAAFDKAMAKMPLPEAKKASLGEAFVPVREELAGIPVARTAPFFDAPGTDSGTSDAELFLLAVDPDACKGCGGCVAQCEAGALRSEPDTASRTREARSLWRLIESLPDPAPASVERARTDSDVGTLAGAMLPKASRETVAAADGADRGSGSSLAVRQALASAAYHLAVRPGAGRPERLAALDALREELASEIHEGLARALPDRDLDALAEGLNALQRPEADLAELTGRVERALEGERVDVARLRRLVEVARRLADLRLHVGGSPEDAAGGKITPTPAPLGLVLAGRASSWAGAFPYTPFAVPVTVDSTGDAASIARGILEGSLRDAVEVARVARRARIEIEATTPSQAARAAVEVRALDGLTWRDLDEAELAVCPPVLLIASEDELLGDDLGGVASLLADDLPVKVLLLSDGWLGSGLGAVGRSLENHPDGRSARPVGDAVLSWAGQSAAFGALVAQSSVGARDHLGRSLEATLAFDGPALLRVHAPEPVRHGYDPAATVERAWGAVASRAFPLYVSRPGDGDGAADLPVVDLAGNPEPEAGWVRASGGGPITPAHWALGEARFADGFGAPVDPATFRGETVPLAELLDLPADEREGKVAVVEDPAAESRLRPVKPALVDAVRARLGAWRLLQRWAAADEAFAKAAGAAEQEERSRLAAEEHQREIAALRADYEQRLAEARATTQAEMARRVREKLLALAVHKAAATAGNGTETPASEATEQQAERPE